MAKFASRGLAAIFALAAASAVAISPAGAKDAQIGHLTLEQPFSRATPASARAGAGYLVIHNHGAEADRLVSVACDCAEKSEIHEMKMEGTIMKMSRLPDGLEIPAGGSATLQPGGYHLMFIGLKEPFAEGEMLKATLTFEKAGSVEVMFPIGPIGAMKGHGSGMGHGMKGHGTMSN